MQPILFLDIDGVINASRNWSRATYENHTGWDDWKTFEIKFIHDGGLRFTFDIHYSPEMISRIRALDVEFVWATTWIQDPIELSKLAHHVNLGIDAPMIDSITFETAKRYAECGKGSGVRSYLADQEHRRFVWVDDELGNLDYQLARSYGADTNLLVRTLSDWGITRSEMEMIEGFIEKDE